MSETTPTTNEVSPPEAEQVEPTYKLSPDAQALRAKLDSQTAAKASTAKPSSKAADQPATDQEQGGQEERTTPAGEYVVQPEIALIPQEHHEEAQQIALDLEAIGQAHGYDAGRMQIVMDAAADLHLSTERDLNLTTREQSLSVLANRYGPEEAGKLISEAQRMADFLGADFKTYLDQTGLGNSIAALNVLAANFRGDLSLTPQQAKAKIAELRKADNSMERHVIDRVRILARVANPKSKADARSYDSRSVSDRVTSSYGAHMTAKEARSELDALQKPGSDLYSADGVKRGKAIKKRTALQARLQGEK